MLKRLSECVKTLDALGIEDGQTIKLTYTSDFGKEES